MADRLLYLASACLAGSVLADSAAEHFRAGVHHPMMLAGPALAAATVAASGEAARRTRGRRACRALYAAGMIGGVIGFAFHARNVARREGGVAMHNLFYGAPIGAPLGLTLAAAFGLAAETGRTRSALLGGLAAAGLAGTAVEAGVLHFRGAFHDPLMYAPVLLPPLASACLAAALVRPARGRVAAARVTLRLTAALGIAGAAAHTLALRRYMGGWRNWTQNLFAGPPIPAPPAFTGIALAGLAVLEARDV
ncbi:MAG TPA: hypothetical protein VHK90_05125 [Thermoanaerobaculia bacterium]|nr:hypothetical protein [Thermoanaerobaculia bacterium]